MAAPKFQLHIPLTANSHGVRPRSMLTSLALFSRNSQRFPSVCTSWPGASEICLDQHTKLLLVSNYRFKNTSQLWTPLWGCGGLKGHCYSRNLSYLISPVRRFQSPALGYFFFCNNLKNLLLCQDYLPPQFSRSSRSHHLSTSGHLSAISLLSCKNNAFPTISGIIYRFIST